MHESKGLVYVDFNYSVDVSTAAGTLSSSSRSSSAFGRRSGSTAPRCALGTPQPPRARSPAHDPTRSSSGRPAPASWLPAAASEVHSSVCGLFVADGLLPKRRAGILTQCARTFVQPTKPLRAATMNAVLPSLAAASFCAPHASSSSTHSWWPLPAATMSAVPPKAGSDALTSTSAVRSRWRTCSCPVNAALHTAGPARDVPRPFHERMLLLTNHWGFCAHSRRRPSSRGSHLLRAASRSFPGRPSTRRGRAPAP